MASARRCYRYLWYRWRSPSSRSAAWCGSRRWRSAGRRSRPWTGSPRALAERRDLDFVLLPAEAVNDDLVFVDDVRAEDLAARLPAPAYLSYDFADVLQSAIRNPQSAIGAGQG